MRLFLFLLALLFTGCAREQAVSAANIGAMTDWLLAADPSPLQAPILRGIKAEAGALQATLGPASPSLVLPPVPAAPPPAATSPAPVPPEVAAIQRDAERHAQEVKASGGTWQMLGNLALGLVGATTTILGIIGGVRAGRAQMSPLVSASSAFGDDMKAALTQADPAVAKRLTAIHAKKQEAAGIRLRLHAARGKSGAPPSVGEITGA